MLRVGQLILFRISLTSPSAYFLVSHGSRDPRSQVALQQLAQVFGQGLAAQNFTASSLPAVQTGTLEFGPMPLHQQIEQFAATLLARGGTQLKVLPVFLLPGAHVMADIPAAVTTASQQLGDRIQLRLCAHLGSHPNMVQVLRDRMSPHPASAQILLAHGSRYPGGNKPVEQLAARLGAVPAYWFGEPNLETRILELTTHGHHHIDILTYFLFAGSITDALTEQVSQLQRRFDKLSLNLIPPLEPSLKLAGLLLDLI